MNQLTLRLGERAVEKRAHACSDAIGEVSLPAAIELADGKINAGKTAPPAASARAS